MTKGHTVEKPQRADDLVQRWPGYPRRNQMNLEGMDIFQVEAGQENDQNTGSTSLRH